MNYDDYSDHTCRYEDETADILMPAYAEAKKTKSFTLHTLGCPKIQDCPKSLRDWSFLLLQYYTTG